jgi:hypothetical protein
MVELESHTVEPGSKQDVYLQEARRKQEVTWRMFLKWHPIYYCEILYF